MKKIYFPLIAFFAILLISCRHDDVVPGQTVEVYLLKSFETVDLSSQIDESSVILESEPLLKYSDLLAYDQSDFSFDLSETGREAVLGSNYSTFRKTFAVVVDDEIIFTGYFWSSFSSSTCQWVIADLLTVEMQGKMKLQLGYPGLFDGVEIPDHRNDKRILAVFKRDGKLER